MSGVVGDTVTRADVLRTAQRLEGVACRTPVLRSDALDAIGQGTVALELLDQAGTLHRAGRRAGGADARGRPPDRRGPVRLERRPVRPVHPDLWSLVTRPTFVVAPSGAYSRGASFGPVLFCAGQLGREPQNGGVLAASFAQLLSNF